jgi:autotransporter-associated beta strand protein
MGFDSRYQNLMPMKTSVQTHCYSLFGYLARLKRYKIITLILMLAALPCMGWADTTWTGTVSQDWDNAGNWNNGLPSSGNGAIFINIATGNYPILTNDASAGNDIIIGAGANGRLDQTKGSLSTGNGNWFFFADGGGTAVYNLCDTTTTGGTITGFGRGSGSLYVGGVSNPNGYFNFGRDPGTTATFNMNSSGTLAAGNMWVSAGGAGTCIFNLDSGMVNISGDCQFGGQGPWGQDGTDGRLNMSGGTLTANVVNFSRGNSGSSVLTGTGNITGGTLNSKQWLTLGFCGTGVGTLTNSGGIINVNTSGGGNMEMTTWDTARALYVQNTGALNLCNGAYIAYGNGGNQSGTATFDQNGGTVTFYSDNGSTVGGSGYLELGRDAGWAKTSGTYTYNLNGGTLTLPQIQKSSSTASGTFNFNGGTLKPTASSATFMQGLTAANVQAGGAVIDTAGFNITIGQALVDGGGGLTKLGSGTLWVTGGCSYSGPTVVNAGTLAVDTTQPSFVNALTVSNASLSVSLDNGLSALYAGNITFQGNTVLNLNYGTASSPAYAAIYAGSSVSNTGTNVINITGSHLVIGQYPLIYTGGSVPTNNFELGPLPTGVVATLVDSGSSLDLLITASGQTLTWYGADGSGNPLTTWDINSSMNWNFGGAKYLQYATNSYGDSVIFDDMLYTASDANITLNSTVVPSSVIFNNSSTPYSITGSGGIGGTASLTISGNGSVFLGTSNSYSGGTVISAGTLSVTDDNALGASSGAVTLAGGTLQFSNSTASVRGISITANSTIDVATNATVQLNNNISGPGGLTKTDNGTLTLGGSSISMGGRLTVNAGLMNVAGGTLDAASIHMITISSGTSTGTLDLNAATVNNSAETVVCDGQNASISGQGTLNVNTGSILNSESDLLLSFAGSGIGQANIAAGTTVNVASTVKRWVIVNVWDTSEGQLTVNGGTLNLNAGTDIQFSTGSWDPGASASTSFATLNSGAITAWSGNHTGAGSSGVLNLNNNASRAVDNTFNLNGGALTIGAIVSGRATGSRVFNFNGGTLKPTASSATFFADGAASAANVRNGGAIIDDGGFAITIGQALTHSDIGGDNATDGGLTKLGAGTLTLSGANTYTGNTTVNAGTLEVVSAGLAANSTVSIASGAKLQLDSATTNQIGALVLNGVTQSPGVYNSNTTPAYITGAGSLIVSAVGPGAFTSTPGITSFTLNGVDVVISGTNGQAGDAYYLLASTNLSLPISQWQTVATNVLSAGGSFTFTGTNVVTTGDNHQFYILSNTNSNH